MEAAISRMKMQLEKLRESVDILAREIKLLEEESRKTKTNRFNDDFSRSKEDFIAP
jgi:cell division protein FtsB